MQWLWRPPREVATRILNELTAEPPGGQRPVHPLSWFQAAGAGRARAVLARRGGVVLADSVGLGKTYIALALLGEALSAGETAAVVVPASLRPVWKPLLRSLAAGSAAGPAPSLLSHAGLARGSYPAHLVGGTGMVVVDEAHRFRNPRTRRYAALAELCAGKRVVLVTATPVNNTPWDLYHLLRLFAADDAFADLGVPGLRQAFGGRGPGTAPGEAADAVAADEVDRVIRDMVVRRTREMLGPAPSGGAGSGPGGAGQLAAVRFPRRSPPDVIRFHDPRIPALVSAIGALELAAFAMPAGTRATGVPALLRLGLLKRLESGSAALRRSLARQIAFHRSFIDALDGGLLLRPSALNVGAGGDGDPLQLLLLELLAEPAPPAMEAARLADSARGDLATLERAHALLAGPDPKIAALRDLIGAVAPEKVVVFTEFRDTAEAVWKALAPVVPVGRVDGSGAWLGRRAAGRRTVIERFAPRASGAADPPPRERVDLLIATDVLSEGVNLQDARHMVSLDLPWNPVRLMQRIGRIDRLGSPHQTVVPHLFLPAQGVDAMIGLTRRLRRKLGDIADTMGGDDALELLTRLHRGSPATGAAFPGPAPDNASAMDTLRLHWHGRRSHAPPQRPAAGPDTGLVADAPPDTATLVLVRHHGHARLMEVDRRGAVVEAGPRAARALARLTGEERPAGGGGPHRTGPHELHRLHRLVELVTRHFRETDALLAAPVDIHPGDPAAVLSRALRRALLDAGAALPPALLARADTALGRLASPTTAAADLRLRRVAGRAGDDLDVPALLTAVEAALGPVLGNGDGHATGSGAGPAETAAPAVLAVLLGSAATPDPVG